MDKFVYSIPGFRGYSLIENRTSGHSSNIKNFEIRETSLKTRKGSTGKVTATTSDIGSMFMLKLKNGDKHYVVAEGTNLLSTSDLISWDTPALKTNCDNAYFDGLAFLDHIYMGNGTDMAEYDGTTFAGLVGPPTFDFITEYKDRIVTNDTTNPAYMRYSDIGVDAPTTIGNYYWILSEHEGDAFKCGVKIMTHFFALCEYSCYAIYGSSSADFSKNMVAPIGISAKRSLVTVNGVAYFLSQNGVYRYSGAGLDLVSYNLGKIEELISPSYMYRACAASYKNKYWLAVHGNGTTEGNDLVLVYDTLAEEWERYEYPFYINDFCVDGNNLYAATSDNLVYLLDDGTTDGTTVIASSWESDALDMGYPGRKKKIKNIAIELADIAIGGSIELYIKGDDGDYGDSYTIYVPSVSPGATKIVRVQLSKFHNLSIKLETNVKCIINKITFGAKVKRKVK